MIDSAQSYAQGAQPPPLSPTILHRIEKCLRRHLGDHDLAPVCAELQRGHVIHDDDTAAGVVAYRNGILFVAGREYVIAD